MSERFKSRTDLRDKIDWEGGITDALDYGIKTEDMPEGDAELTEAWGKLEAAWRALAPLAEAVDNMLNDVADDENDWPAP